jgi:hypothetical protein
MADQQHSQAKPAPAINSKESCLAESLSYAIRNIRHIRELLEQPEKNNQTPGHADSIVFEIKTEIPFQPGSKLNDPEGTKGVIRINPHMPFIKTGEGWRPADIAITTHAILARGSFGKLNKTPEDAESRQTILIHNPDGGLTTTDVQILDTCYSIQKSSLLDNKVMGRFTKQSANHLGLNIDGASMSYESQIHAAGLLPLFHDLAETPPKKTGTEPSLASRLNHSK